MSIKSEILGIARGHGYKGNAQTIKGAINALADTLAGEDAHDGKTIASAIRALSPYVGEVPSGTISITENGENIDVSSYAKADVSVSGGGSFGNLQLVLQAAAAPNVGDSGSGLTPAIIALVGTDVDTVLAAISGSADDCEVASGAYVAIAPNDAGATGATGYLVTLDTETGKLTTVTQWDGEFTLVPDPTAQEEYTLVCFTVPETQAGEYFVVVVSYT